MKIAHLILAHKNPAQLEKLIRALQHSLAFFYIHVDKKSDIKPFEYLVNLNNVSFIKRRTKIYWAGYGTIQATLNGIEEIPLHNYNHVNVISAQDFPIKSPEYIYNFLSEKKDIQFITCESVKDVWKEAEIRVTKYHFINWKIPGKFIIEKLVNKILPERKFPYKYEIVGRANWFTITSEAAQYILHFIKRHPQIVHFFKYSWGADELIFSTILYNSYFKNKIEDNLVYVDWSEEKAHPKILNSDDLNALASSEKLFARKFDAEKDARIIELVEKNLLKNTVKAK